MRVCVCAVCAYVCTPALVTARLQAAADAALSKVPSASPGAPEPPRSLHARLSPGLWDAAPSLTLDRLRPFLRHLPGRPYFAPLPALCRLTQATASACSGTGRQWTTTPPSCGTVPGPCRVHVRTSPNAPSPRQNGAETLTRTPPERPAPPPSLPATARRPGCLDSTCGRPRVLLVTSPLCRRHPILPVRFPEPLTSNHVVT